MAYTVMAYYSYDLYSYGRNIGRGPNPNQRLGVILLWPITVTTYIVMAYYSYGLY